MATPAYMSITGTKQGLITAGAFTEESRPTVSHGMFSEPAASGSWSSWISGQIGSAQMRAPQPNSVMSSSCRSRSTAYMLASNSRRGARRIARRWVTADSLCRKAPV